MYKKTIQIRYSNNEDICLVRKVYSASFLNILQILSKSLLIATLGHCSSNSSMLSSYFIIDIVRCLH